MASKTSRQKGQKGQTSRPRNPWIAEQRKVVHCLFSHFQSSLSLNKKAAIFNVYFRDYLTSHGLPDGLPGSTIRAQYAMLSRAPATWARIVADPTTDREWQLRHEINDKIRRIASELDARAPLGQMTPIVATPQAKAPASRVVRRTTSQVVISSKQPVAGAADEAGPIPEGPLTPSNSSRKSAIARRKQRHYAAERSSVSTARKAGMEHPMLPPHTSISSRPLKENPTTKMPLVRNNGPVVFLSPEKHATARQELSPVLPHEAHNPPSRLLFRYFDNSTSHLGARANGVLEGRGFRATSFSFNNCRLPNPPASVSDRLFADIENHVNRNHIASPFISTTDNLLWLLSRIALQEYQNGKPDGYVSIIDSKALSREEIFHPKFYHRRLKTAYVFTEGAWNYSGRSEYLVWARIPQHAVINTFSVLQLVDFVKGIRGLQVALRLDKISRRMCSLEKTILPELQKDEFELTVETIVGFGKLCAFFGLSDLSHVQSLVTSLVFGWRLKIEAQSPEMWAKDAALFAEAFLAGSNKAMFRLEYLEQLKLAYLSGVREGYKGTFNMLHEPQRQQNVNR
ncbi:hypothetical protein KC336_g19694, partial [Hortaea werneckii]